jgi:hypothetical protein
MGKESSIAPPLLAFNIGLEIGQILIITIHFLILFFAISFFKVNHKNWRIYISAAAAAIASVLILKNKLW